MLAIATGAEVMVSPDREAGARALEALGVDLILCDDGLQHYALARDLEIVVIDAARGLGNGRLLPAGPLREQASRLESVDWVVVNGVADGNTASGAWRGRQGSVSMMLVPEALRGVADPLRWCSLESLRGEPVHAVAGIGHPARFFGMLRAVGLEVIEHAFVDHHAFAAGDLDFGDTHAILMTSKDAVKCRSFAAPRCWEVPVVARFAPEGAASLATAIEKLCRFLGLVPPPSLAKAGITSEDWRALINGNFMESDGFVGESNQSIIQLNLPVSSACLELIQAVRSGNQWKKSPIEAVLALVQLRNMSSWYDKSDLNAVVRK